LARLPLGLLPHHDGSALYVANQSPTLGAVVSVRMRIHPKLGEVSRVFLRQSDSGEGFLVPSRKLSGRAALDTEWLWFEAKLTMWNPQVHYRFFIELKGQRSYWLNATGLHRLDTPDRDDFQINTFGSPPGWATGAVLYQIFPDRFARSKKADSLVPPDWAIPKPWGAEVTGTGPGTGEQFFGGDFWGAADKIEHVKRLGATILYTTPFFAGRSNHRYDASDFDQVDPLLGGNAAFTALVKKAHAAGLKVMGDLTANHIGAGHEWFRRAFGNPKAPESEFFYFSNQNRKYESWWGVKSLPKLNWNSSELRRRFILNKDSVLVKWLRAPFALDGWRIDVANMTGWIGADNMNHEVGALIRKRMSEVNPDSFLIGEFTSDAAELISGDTYQSAMTYSNFTRPLWRWLWNPAEKRDEGQVGVGRKCISAADFVELHNRFGGVFPWQLRMHNLNALDTHDTGRFKTFTLPGAQRLAVGMQFTFPGIPMVFAGDEFGLDGWNGESSRTPIPWNGERASDPSLIEWYAALAELRRRHPALVSGSFRWVYASTEALAFLRETSRERLLVLASRGRDAEFAIDKSAVEGVSSAKNLFGGAELKIGGKRLRYKTGELDFQVWQLSR
jgi:alpha-glucosidase